MDLILGALGYIFDPVNWGAGAVQPGAIGGLLLEHLRLTALCVGIALVVALPLGFYIGHTGRARQFVIGFTGAMRALPTLGLLYFFFTLFAFSLSFLPAANLAVVISLIVLAIPSILAGAYSGLESVDRETIDASRALGMTEFQILWQVEVPLALPLIVGGIRASVLQVIATATVAAYIGGGGLGTNDYDRILGGALLVTALALVVDGVFALLQRLATVGEAPRGVRDTDGDASRTPLSAEPSAQR
jgi:osmoprotectant transport system permease protein